MTRDEFEAEYAARSGITVEELRTAGRIVVPCTCDSDMCKGWASVRDPAGQEGHEAMPLRGSIRDQTGPIGEPVTSDYMLWNARYPLAADCACGARIQRDGPESIWRHRGTVVQEGRE